MLLVVIRIATGLLVGLFALVAPRVATAAPDWVGDFETGDLSQWSQFSASTGNYDHVGVTQEVVYEGEWAGRIELDPGDVASTGLTRNELIYEPADAIEDTERYYSMSIRRESSDDWGDSWHLLWFWEGNPVFSNVISLNALGTMLEYRSYIGDNTEQWTAPFTPDVWHDFVLHVYWSADPSTGFIELYYGGEVVVPLTHLATMHGPGVGNCMHAGLVRDDAITVNEFVYLDNARAGDTLEDVMPMRGGDTGGSGDGSDSDGGDDVADDTGSGGGDDGTDTDGNGDDAPGDDTADDGSATGSGDSTGASAAADGDGDGDDGGGCSCRARPHSPTWLLLALLPVLRRRRARPAAGAVAKQ